MRRFNTQSSALLAAKDKDKDKEPPTEPPAAAAGAAAAGGVEAAVGAGAGGGKAAKEVKKTLIANTAKTLTEQFKEAMSGTDGLTPSKTVELLDKFIVGQADAKRACAVALRNRWRRHRVVGLHALRSKHLTDWIT